VGTVVVAVAGFWTTQSVASRTLAEQRTRRHVRRRRGRLPRRWRVETPTHVPLEGGPPPVQYAARSR